MFDPITPLGQTKPEVVTIGLWTITETVDVALASLAARRGRGADVVRLAAAAGVPLPGAGRYEAATVYGAFWLTPEMWMIEAALPEHEDIRAVMLALFGDAASITEQTGAWVRFDVTGDDVARLLERLCNVDLRGAAVGHATRTVMDHLGCYVILRSVGQVTIYGPRSSAASLWHALGVAARSLV